MRRQWLRSLRAGGEAARDERMALLGQGATRSAVGPDGASGIKSVALFPPPIDRLLGRENCYLTWAAFNQSSFWIG
jgi:hypothetical protein